MSLELASVLLTALALVPPMAHLLELPNKIRLSREEYLIAQRTYVGWARLGVVTVLALLCTLALAVLLRAERAAFVFALVAGACIAATLGIFWRFTYPVNQATRNWTITPPDWVALRWRWERSHAASALLMMAGFASLVLSVLARQHG